MTRTLYPALVNPPQPQVGSDMNPWIQPWSEPVRPKIKPALAIALIVSGLFATPFVEDQSNYAKWGSGWSEPVRVKPALKTAEQQAFFAPSQFVEPQNLYPKWGYPWSIPSKLSKTGLGAWLQQFATADTKTPSGTTVNVRMAVTEVNGDIASMAINVYTATPSVPSLAAVEVSIEEVVIGGSDPFSIRSG